jgi:hypothetical protein
MRVFARRIDDSLLIGPAVEPVGEAARHGINAGHANRQQGEPGSVDPHHPHQHECHRTVDNRGDRGRAQGLLDLVDRNKARCHIAGVAALEEAERQAQHVPEEAHLPIERQGGASGDHRPGAHEVDQRAKGEHQPDAERDQGQQVAVVRDDDVIEHKLEADRNRDPDGLQDQRHCQHLGRSRGKPMGAAQQLPYPDPRAFRFALEILGRPGFERNPGETRVDFLLRHGSTAHGGIVDDDAAPTHLRQHHEMIVVPVQDATSGKL